MIVNSYLIATNKTKAVKDTGLSLDEIEELTGRYRRGSKMEGSIRGEVAWCVSGKCYIRDPKHLTIYWESQCQKPE